MLKPVEEPANVAILGSDPVTGKALKSLLRRLRGALLLDSPHLMAGMIGKLTIRLGKYQEHAWRR